MSVDPPSIPPLAGISVVEFEGIEPLIKDFNDGFNGKTEYPLVADPDIAEFNRYQVQNKSIADTTLTLGRQRLIWDNQRWVGNVGWRLNEQTYDGFRVENGSIENLGIEGFLLTNVNLPNGLNWKLKLKISTSSTSQSKRGPIRRKSTMRRSKSVPSRSPLPPSTRSTSVMASSHSSTACMPAEH